MSSVSRLEKGPDSFILPGRVVSHHDIEASQSLSYTGYDRYFLQFAFFSQVLIVSPPGRVMGDRHHGCHVEPAANLRSSAPDTSLARVAATIAIEWSLAHRSGDLLAIEQNRAPASNPQLIRAEF